MKCFVAWVTTPFTRRQPTNPTLVPVSHDTLVVFDSNNVKHIDAENFDGDEPYLYKSNIEAPEFFHHRRHERRDGNNGYARLPGCGDNLSVRHRRIRSLRPPYLKQCSKCWRDASLTMQTQPLFKQMLPQIRTNARRLRDSGAHWIADFLQPNSGAGMFEKLDVATARTLMPIYKVLNDLPGATTRPSATSETPTRSRNRSPHMSKSCPRSAGATRAACPLNRRLHTTH